jgi:very-short-patch-repair endonuclease
MGQGHHTGRQAAALPADHRATGPAAHWLWQAVRARKTGVKFRRQVPFGPYVVDFCSHQARLVISLCGPARDSWQRSGDLALRAYVQALGYRLITLTDSEVLDQTDLALERIAAVVDSVTLPPQGHGAVPLAADHRQH